MTDVFDLWETKLGFLGVDSDILSPKALEYSSDVTEEFRVGFTVYEYIIDVNKSIEDLVLHTATHVHWYRPLTALKAVSTRDTGSRGV